MSSPDCIRFVGRHDADGYGVRVGGELAHRYAYKTDHRTEGGRDCRKCGAERQRRYLLRKRAIA